MFGNGLINDMILYSTTCIALACKSLTVVEIMISVFDKVENTVGKEEDTGRKYWQILATTIFSPSPTLFSNFIPFPSLSPARWHSKNT